MFRGMKMTNPPVHGLEIQEENSRWSESESNFVPATESNVLECLKTNLNKLEDLHSRLRFMLGEIKVLIRK
ncbi:MAG: hypothetical protein ABL958_11520 [Bdellovibrionia bacterium]